LWLEYVSSAFYKWLSSIRLEWLKENVDVSKFIYYGTFGRL